MDSTLKRNWFREGIRSTADSTSPLAQSASGVILYITLLGDGSGWKFEWPSTGATYYRIVLRGQVLAVVPNDTNGMLSYSYAGVGFVAYPPPLEVMEEEAIAPSELNRPFITIQWYGDEDASYYIVEEYISGTWTTMFETAEAGAAFYSWSSPILVDESTHTYRVTAYNTIDQASTPIEFDISPVVTPPDFNEALYNVTYDDAAEEITFDLIA